MTREEIVAAIEEEIGRLEQVRGLLQTSNSERLVALAGSAKPGPEKSAGGKQKRTMSPEARKRIALAQKRRWAKQKREAGSASDTKK